MIPKIVPDHDTADGLPIGTKFDDAIGRPYVRIIGGFACREAGCVLAGSLFSSDELCFPLTVTHIPEASS